MLSYSLILEEALLRNCAVPGALAEAAKPQRQPRRAVCQGKQSSRRLQPQPCPAHFLTSKSSWQAGCRDLTLLAMSPELGCSDACVVIAYLLACRSSYLTLPFRTLRPGLPHHHS